MGSSGNPKVVLFGSFTEEETRVFQKTPVSSQSQSPSLEKKRLQFGSLDFGNHSDLPATCKSVLPLGLATETNGKKGKKAEMKKPLCVLPNGSTNGCHDITDKPQINGKISTSELKIGAKNLLPKNVDKESTKDVTSITTESSFEMHKDQLNKVHQKEDFIKKAGQKMLNGERVAIRPLLPRGLINSGNLCFLNATLQALLSCSPFVQLLQTLRTRNIPKLGFPTLVAFVEFISDFDMPEHPGLRKNDHSVLETGKSFSPVMFKTVLKAFTPDLSTNLSGRPRQEDAQEFLCFVMDKMHDELLKLDGHLASTNGLVSSAEDDDGWETVGPKNKSAVTRTQSFLPSELSDIFGGQLKSVVKASGNKASATVQPFLLLHLDIFPDTVHTIEDALHLFCAPETLEGYKAAAEKSTTVSASKSVKIQTVPNILILHLMRFSYGSKGMVKLHKPVHFSPELVLARELLVSPSSEGRRYQLVATITHHGRDPSKGHYTSDTRYSNGTWLRYDDASVTSVPMTRVLHDQAYVLFYKQL